MPVTPFAFASQAYGPSPLQRNANVTRPASANATAKIVTSTRRITPGSRRGLVDDDRERRALPHAQQAREVVRRDRLLAALDAERHEPIDAARRLVGRPGGVRVDADRAVVPLPDRSEDRDLVARAELHLE